MLARQLRAVVRVARATRRTRRRSWCSTVRSRAINVPLSKTLKTIATTHARSSGSAFQRGMTIDTYTVTGSADRHGARQDVQHQREPAAAQHSQRDDRQDPARSRFAAALRLRRPMSSRASTTRRPRPTCRTRCRTSPTSGCSTASAACSSFPAPATRRTAIPARGWCSLPPSTAPIRRTFTATSRRCSSRTCTSWAWSGAGPTPNQRLSNYAGFIGVRRNYQYGIPGTAANTLGTLGTNAATLGSTIDPNLVYYAPQFLSSNDFVDNLIYRFGKNQGQRLQFFIQDQDITQHARLRRLQYLPYISGGTTAGQVRALSGASVPTARSTPPSRTLPATRSSRSFPGQPNTYAFVSQADSLKSPFLAYKLEYGVNLGTHVAADGALLPDVLAAVAGHAGARHLRARPTAANAPPARST